MTAQTIVFPDFTEAELEEKALAQMRVLKERKERVAIALSGGTDSVFALFVCVKFFGSENCVALHYNHAVRETATRDELYSKSLCEKLGVKFISKTREITPKKITEETLRVLRHKFFEESCAAEKISYIVVAHMKNDIAETMLMRLMRGASLRGLCAPKSVSKKNNLTFLRPILNFEKEEIIRRLCAKKIEWREDETNAQCLYLRNKLRNIILPEIKKIAERNLFDGFARSRKLLEEDESFLQQLFVAKTKILSPQKIIFLDAACVASPSILRRGLSLLESQNEFHISAAAADKFIGECLAKNSAQACAGNAFLIFDKKSLSLEIFTPPQKIKYFKKLEFGKNELPDGAVLEVERVQLSETQFFAILKGEVDEAKVAFIRDGNFELFAKNIEKTDAYIPLGCSVKKTILAQMSAKKTPILKRNSFPLVCLENGEGVWSPTLAPCDSLKLSQKGQAIRLTYSQKS